jgi:hypothetical protein
MNVIKKKKREDDVTLRIVLVQTQIERGKL